MLAGHREIRHVVAGVYAALAAFDVDLAMAMARLRGGVARPIVVNMLILAGHEAVVAVMTQG